MEKLLQRPPKFSKTIEIAGISLSDAFKRPDLRSALESFHDRLYWSEIPDGVEEILLCYAFAVAGNPILGCPHPATRRRLSGRISVTSSTRTIERQVTMRIGAGYSSCSLQFSLLRPFMGAALS